MNERLEAVQTRFLENLSRMSDAFGLNDFVVKLYGFLYLNATPQSLDDISAALGASKGNVSINIRELENWGAVKKVWVKGSRKDFYIADPDIKKVLSNKLKSSIQKRIIEVSGMVDEFNRMISSAEHELNEEERNIARGYQERLKKIEELSTLASNTLSFADKLL